LPLQHADEGAKRIKRIGDFLADQSVGFEVASIKLTSRPDFGLRRPPSPDRFLRQNITLSLLLAYAYDVGL